MPKYSASKLHLLRSWVSKYPELMICEDKIFCTLCAKNIDDKKKNHIDNHCKTALHIGKKAQFESGSLKKQPPINLPSASKAEEFAFDLTKMLVSSNIPFFKLKGPLSAFIEKYSGLKVPDESTLRKTYLKRCFDYKMDEIKAIIAMNYCYIQVDETTDILGRNLCSILIGVLKPDVLQKSFLIKTECLEKTNSQTVCKFINDALREFFGNDHSFQERILLLVSDAAPYMVKVGRNLTAFYENLIHVTCLAHAINRVAEKVRDSFPRVNKLINNGKKILLKCPQRIEMYHAEMNCGLPPEPILTRWGTWLKCAIFYSDVFPEFKRFVRKINDEQTLSVRKIKEIVEKPEIIGDLAFIKTHLSFLPEQLTKLETQNMLLQEQIDIIKNIETKLKTIPSDDKGKVIQEKFHTVLSKNKGFETVKNYCEILSGEAECHDGNENPRIISAFKYAPLTSCDVERHFSRLKNVLSDKRTNFTMDNLNMYMVSYQN